MRIPSPKQAVEQLPHTPQSEKLVQDSRREISKIINNSSSRKLVIVGPCSIHRFEDALYYADLLAKIRECYIDKLEIIMRVYFEKPRTRGGWKGLIYDPWIDGSHDIQSGLQVARRITLGVLSRGVPVAHELLDVISPMYLADTISWGAIGARTTESQIHRQLASSCAYPVGFKNATSGNLRVAVDAAYSATKRHSFLSVDRDGCVSVEDTAGNSAAHVILRGSENGPNFSKDNLLWAKRELSRIGLERGLIVDLSHGNSGKDPKKQISVLKSIIHEGSLSENLVAGIMVESNIFEGRQPESDLWTLKRGVSITDGCISIPQTEQLIAELAEAI